MRAIVVRHYKTLLNATDQIIGWGDAPRVKGWQRDLSFVNDRLRERGISPELIYSSDLERARQTAMFYARCHGIHLSLIHISEPTRPFTLSRMPSSA